jgi:NitT/TauT family transport system substrate-binding protein
MEFLMSTNVHGQLKVAPNGRAFDLPVLVGIEEGIFESRGLSVELSGRYEDRPLAERDVFARLKESQFETGIADVYNVCEWASIDRLERGSRPGQVAILRAAVAAQALLTFDPTLNEPHDLGDIPVGVNEFTGSHYTTLQLLEGALPRERVRIEHVGGPDYRMDQLRSGGARVVALMEPFISLALKLGAHIIASTFYRGAEVVGANLSSGVRSAYLDSINEAVDRINAAPADYAHLLVEPTNGELRPEELSGHFLHYIHVTPYPRERLTETYSWMRSWGLAGGEVLPEQLVAIEG